MPEGHEPFVNKHGFCSFTPTFPFAIHRIGDREHCCYASSVRRDVAALQLVIMGHRDLWLKPQAIVTPLLRSESQIRVVDGGVVVLMILDAHMLANSLGCGAEAS